MNAPLASIAVGVVVERSKSSSRWGDYLWRPISAFTGAPTTPVWSKLEGDDERALFYAGAAEIELHRTETTYYRDNLASGAPLLWVVLRPSDGEPPYRLTLVTADPAEGEAVTLVGDDLVDSVPMPPTVQQIIGAFIAEHHVEHEFVKRERDRANPEALARRIGDEDLP